MNTQPEALHLADCLEQDCEMNWPDYDTQMDAAIELRRLHAANVDCVNHFNAIKAERDALLTVAKELQESAAYWSEYDVPLGIVDRLNAAIAKVAS